MRPVWGSGFMPTPVNDPERAPRFDPVASGDKSPGLQNDSRSLTVARLGKSLTVIPELVVLHSPGLFADDPERDELTMIQLAGSLHFDL